MARRHPQASSFSTAGAGRRVLIRTWRPVEAARALAHHPRRPCVAAGMCHLWSQQAVAVLLLLPMGHFLQQGWATRQGPQLAPELRSPLATVAIPLRRTLLADLCEV